MTDELPPELKKELLVKRLAIEILNRPKFCPADSVDQSPDNEEFPTPTNDLDSAQNLCRDLLNLHEKDRLSRKQRSRKHKFEQRFKYGAEMTFEKALQEAKKELKSPTKEVAKFLY